MVGIFRVSEEKTAARYKYRARASTRLTRKRPPSREDTELLMFLNESQSFQLGFLRPGRRRARLTVRAPRRLPLLAGTQIASVQTIPFEQDSL